MLSSFKKKTIHRGAQHTQQQAQLSSLASWTHFPFYCTNTSTRRLIPVYAQSQEMATDVIESEMETAGKTLKKEFVHAKRIFFRIEIKQAWLSVFFFWSRLFFLRIWFAMNILGVKLLFELEIKIRFISMWSFCYLFIYSAFLLYTSGLCHSFAVVVVFFLVLIEGNAVHFLLIKLYWTDFILMEHILIERIMWKSINHRNRWCFFSLSNE